MRDLAVEAAPVEGAEPTKKFGMFLGVFTPSILTILGVIMYQRFGWVVGHAGLWGTLAIVGLAHVISITTGLSVASIATNHAVKTGGNYYIISRSLGLSVGGAIGLALYVALALGVSLYLIGFAEAFVAATGWSPMGNLKDSIRVIGTAACIAISLLTLYSTSFALKSQLFVLAAIVGSLFAIFLGTPLQILPSETMVGNMAPKGAEDFATVFAVFFPAVTGFTAGVGMSGDLKDPKKAIPIGTMFAILTGLAIYVTLPIFLSRMAPVEQLQNDTNILLRIAVVPQLVTAGVFAATLSSALGSILGAPRTLQALAFDGIVPRFLGRGREEPRLALLVTILIAEAGILVGELELVGAIISMFFLTCYGFLCLACGLERWASPDFRPSFKVPVWVSLLGAVACFMVMFQIDALSMFGAIIIMGLIYLVLKRRQLVLGSGDTWGGVWSAVVRLGLMKLRASESRGLVRNWRPNMIVLARARTRRDLIDFGRTIVGDRGILTHFDFVRGGPTRPTVDAALEAEYPGMFARTQGCEDVFEAIPGLASSYGMAGMETNSVLIGWPQEYHPNDRYGRMVERLIQLDVSVLMLRFDRDRGFGRREKIDVWWDGVSSSGQLMLTLCHLLHTTPEWKNARVRVLVNGQRGADEASVTRRLEETIAEARVKAEPILLAPLAEEGMLADRVRQESARADLVMIEAQPAGGDGFVATNDELIRPLGTALLIHASSTFAVDVGIFEGQEDPTGASEEELGLELPADPVLAPVVAGFEAQLNESLERFATAVQQPAIEEERTFIQEVVAEVEQIRQLERRLGRRGNRREGARGLVDWARQRFNAAAQERIQRFMSATKSKKVGDEIVLETAWERRLREGTARLRADMADALMTLPPTVSVPTVREDWAPREGDPRWFRFLKFRVRVLMKLGMRPPNRKLPVRAVATQFLGPTFNRQLERAIRQIGVRRFDAIRRVRRLVSDVERFFSNLLAELDQSAEPTVDVGTFKELVLKEAVGMEDVAFAALHRFESQSEDANTAVRSVLLAAAHQLVEELLRPELAHEGGMAVPSKELKAGRKAGQALGELPSLWNLQHESISAALLLDVQVATLTVEVRRSLQQLFHRVRREIEQGPLQAMQRAVEIMQRVVALREKQESLNTGDIADDKEAAGEEGSTRKEKAKSSEEGAKKEKAKNSASSGAEKPADESEDPQGAVRQAFLSAADELRATFDVPYRPNPRELIDQLLAGLGRATERLPESVTTLSERALDHAAQGSAERARVSYPARRLAQAFLEKSVVQPSRAAVRRLPERMQSAQSVLADAVRLVTFELEQAAGVGDGEDQDDLGLEESGTLALGGMLEERIRRLDTARRNLEGFLAEFRTSLLDDTVRALEEAREAVTGTTGVATQGSQALGLPRANVVPKMRAALRKWEGRLGAAVDAISEREEVKKERRAVGITAGTLADDVLALREKLLPNPEVQASLPLIYRRIFGRTPLETTDLLRGRDRQLEALERMVMRWKSGTGGPIAIIGDPRSGRSSLANIVSREMLSDRASFRVMPEVGGTCDSEALNQAVAAAVGAREGQSAESALRSLAPGAVLMIDDLGRWIERAPAGLNALSLWLRLWRRFGERHLFVLTTTPYAWVYADQLVGVAESFLGTTTCAPVSHVALRQILALRQRTSDFALSFGAQDDRGAFRKALFYSESSQLKRLFERSRGNVGDALDLWRRSIVDATERRITLSVGPEPDTGVLSRLPLRWYAALAAVSLHRSVSVARMARILRISREDATGLLSDLERASLLSADRTGAWALDPVLLPHILRALRSRGALP